MAQDKKAKVVQVKVNVGQDVDIQKLIGQVHTYVAKSKMADRIEIYVNGAPSVEEPATEGLDLL